MNLFKKIKNKNSNDIHNNDGSKMFGYYISYINENKMLSIDLNAKIESFINWYFENMVKENCADTGDYQKTIELRNFIEKMAVWYELRYPKYEIYGLMSGSEQEFSKIDNIMFKNNQYLKATLDEETLKNSFNWAEFYNMHAFFQALPGDEQWYLERPKYNDIVYINKEKGAHVHISNKGFVTDDHDCRMIRFESNYPLARISTMNPNGKYIGKHITQLKSLALEDGFITEDDIISGNCEIDKVIDNYNKRVYFKENLLNSVMYRIIERGGNRSGPKRGMLFAKEFNRNIDIPMIYGADTTDPGLRLFINEYLKLGGKKDLVCYENYFRRGNCKVGTVTIQELLNMETNYTKEERMLHEKLATLLATQIDYDAINKEKVKTLRIERKLEKSRR